MPAIGVLALQGDFEAHGSVLAHLGVNLGVTGKYVRRPADLEEIAGLILPGGESTTVLKLLESEGLWEPVRRFAGAHPVFGTCAGAILMADRVEGPAQGSLALMRITLRRNAYGRQLSSSIRQAEMAPELDPDGDQPSNPPQPKPALLNSSLPALRKSSLPALQKSSLEVVLIRAPLITELGPQVRVLASVDGQPILVREGNLLAATFHPELTSDTRVHDYFSRMVLQN